MGRYTGPRHKACRRARTPLCQSKRCPVDPPPIHPRGHGRARTRQTNYLTRPREKESRRPMSGRRNRRFRRYDEEAARRPGITGENLLRLREQRLDNVVWRSGLAATRPQARQLVNHGHFRVNGKKVDIASYQVRPGDVVTIKDASRDSIVIQHAVDTQGREAPAWLSVDLGERKVAVMDQPRRDQIDTDINEQLIVELYSK